MLVADEQLLNFISECKLEIKFKSLNFDIMDHLPKLKEGLIFNKNGIVGGSIWSVLSIYIKINNIDSLTDDKLYQKYFDNFYYVNLESFISSKTTVFKCSSGDINFKSLVEEYKLLLELCEVFGIRTRLIYDNIASNDFSLPAILRNANLMHKFTVTQMFNKNINTRLMNTIMHGDDNMIINCLNMGACPFIGYSFSSNNQCVKFALIKKLWLINEALLNKCYCDDVNNIIMENLSFYIYHDINSF